MKKLTKSILLLIMASIFMLLAACGDSGGDANVSDYPSKPLEVVVPFGAGGDTDIYARTIAKYLEDELEGKVVVSNIEGSGSAVGTQDIYNSDADGYNLLFTHTNLILNEILGVSDISFNDFKIGGNILSDRTTTIVVHADSKYNTLDDLIEDAKANPGEINMGVGYGSYSELVALALEEEANIDLNIIDVGGGADAKVSLSGGRSDVMSSPYGQVKENIEADEFRSLGLLTEERNPDLPNEPTLKEQGVDIGLDKDFTYYFPEDTPDEIVDVFSDALRKVAENEDFKEDMAKYFISVEYDSSTEAQKKLEETDRIYTDLRSGFED